MQKPSSSPFQNLLHIHSYLFFLLMIAFSANTLADEDKTENDKKTDQENLLKLELLLPHYKGNFKELDIKVDLPELKDITLYKQLKSAKKSNRLKDFFYLVQTADIKTAPVAAAIYRTYFFRIEYHGPKLDEITHHAFHLQLNSKYKNNLFNGARLADAYFMLIENPSLRSWFKDLDHNENAYRIGLKAARKLSDSELNSLANLIYIKLLEHLKADKKLAQKQKEDLKEIQTAIQQYHDELKEKPKTSKQASTLKITKEKLKLIEQLLKNS